jgi:hypothetical protein
MPKKFLGIHIAVIGYIDIEYHKLSMSHHIAHLPDVPLLIVAQNHETASLLDLQELHYPDEIPPFILTCPVLSSMTETVVLQPEKMQDKKIENSPICHQCPNKKPTHCTRPPPFEYH